MLEGGAPVRQQGDYDCVFEQRLQVSERRGVVSVESSG